MVGYFWLEKCALEVGTEVVLCEKKEQFLMYTVTNFLTSESSLLALQGV